MYPILLLSTATLFLATSATVLRREEYRPNALPNGSPALSQFMIISAVGTSDGLSCSITDETYRAVCNITLADHQPDFDPRPCDKTTFQWRYTSWTNKTWFDFALEHTLQDKKGKPWVKTCNTEIPFVNMEAWPPAPTEDDKANVNVTAGPAGWTGDAFPPTH